MLELNIGRVPQDKLIPARFYRLGHLAILLWKRNSIINHDILNQNFRCPFSTASATVLPNIWFSSKFWLLSILVLFSFKDIPPRRINGWGIRRFIWFNSRIASWICLINFIWIRESRMFNATRCSRVLWSGSGWNRLNLMWAQHCKLMLNYPINIENIVVLQCRITFNI